MAVLLSLMNIVGVSAQVYYFKAENPQKPRTVFVRIFPSCW
jgi:hypothetical protein